MAIFASINDVRIHTATVSIPYHGVFVVDAQLDQSAVPTGLLTVVLGDLTLKCTAYRSGSFTGVAYIRAVGGAGGWMRAVPAKEYKSSFGVKFSVVAGDAARETGEQLAAFTDFTVGNSYCRQAARAGRVLDTWAPLWWMRTDGVTIVGERAAPTITSPFDVMSGTNLGVNKIMVATDSPNSWQPGVKFSSSTLSERQASGVVHKLTKDQLRTEVWCL